MKPIQKIIVSIHLDNQEISVGELVQNKKTIYFKYYSDFIKSNLSVSPFHLPLQETIFTAPAHPFEGLFGVFSDSLPDGWGRLLLDRTLAKKGILIEEVSPLQRLAHVGTRGMGALIYRPEIETTLQEDLQLELETVYREMNLVLEGNTSSVIDELYQMGGSSGGARPKIVVGYNPKTEHIIHGNHDLPDDYEPWIIKFPSSNDRTDSAQIEYAYYKMAVDAEISMNPCHLFKSQSGKLFFGTKRFDRTLNGKLHLHSAAGLLNDNFRLSTLDYGHLMDATFQLEKDVIAHEKIFRIAAFNVFAHNRDDHSKNISYLMDGGGKWKLAPAYDLTFSNSSHGYHSTMIAGESEHPNTSHLLNLANHFGIKKAKAIIKEVQSVVSDWKRYADTSSVENESKKIIDKKIQQLIMN